MAATRTAMALAAGCLAIAGFLAGCGSGAVEGPDGGGAPGPTRETDSRPDGNGNGDGKGDGNGNGNGNGEEFEFSLPKGDRSVSLNEAIGYDDLFQGKCGEVQTFLDGTPDTAPAWLGMLSPRNVLLFQAGVHLCRGDVAAARPWFDRADQYGWSGSAEFHTCQLYKAAGSVIRQRPKSAFVCQGGDEPPWPEPGPFGRDDPRTEIDEGDTPPSSPPTPEPAD